MILEAENIFDVDNVYLIDVRSEKEFREGSIYGSVNIPILNDKEREIVGKVYINESVEKAKSIGIGFVGNKLQKIFDQISFEFSKHKNIVIFCARGGMRSSSLHNVLNSVGIKNFKLDKGYKGYRKFLINKMNDIFSNINFIVIHGKTGIGKTTVLENLRDKGYPVLHLEEAANHRASFLGGVNLGHQNSQKQFESIIFHKIMGIINDEKYKSLFELGRLNVFVEGESKRIGNVIIPEYIFSKMLKGIHLFIDADVDFRLENLLKEYLNFKQGAENIQVEKSTIDEFRNGLEKLKKYSTEIKVDSYIKLLDDGFYRELALKLINEYYDPKYNNSMARHTFYEKIYIKEHKDFLEKMEDIYSKVRL